MNIFILDFDPHVAALYHADKHCVKMILESAQLLCSTMRVHDIDYGYKLCYRNHPCRKWLDESRENFYWLKKLGLSLCKEYTFRYGKIHKSQKILEECYCPDSTPDSLLTPFVQAMPDKYKNKDAVIAYRNYYIGEKSHIFQWKNRKIPYWIKDNNYESL
jgi:hypothetical protein